MRGSSWLQLSGLFAAAVVAVVPAQAGANTDFPATLLVIADDLITLDPALPSAEALVARGEEIIAVGTADAMRRLTGPDTLVIEAPGRVVVPGFNDAHLHPTPLYDEMSPWGTIDCSPAAAATIDRVVERLRQKAAITPAGQWVRGSGYQDTKLGRHPTRADLDRVSTEHPVLIGHSSGHVAACNSLALALARIDADSDDPKGGRFDRDAAGVPTGVLRESAVGIVTSAGPERPTPETATWIEAIHKRFDEYLAAGITSIQHAGTSLRTVAKYRRALAARRQVRISAMLREGEIDELEKLIADRGRGDDWLQLGGIKAFHGNSLSGQTCWLSQPYADRPDYFGIPPSRSRESLVRLVGRIHDAGLQACIHANGDREIAMVLDAYASHQDHRKGTLAPGKLADFVVLAHDPRTTPADSLRTIGVELTVVGGQVAYRKEGSTLPAPIGR